MSFGIKYLQRFSCFRNRGKREFTLWVGTLCVDLRGKGVTVGMISPRKESGRGGFQGRIMLDDTR